MGTAVAPAQPDTRDMLMVHRVFRRECRLMPDLIRAVPAGDAARAQILADHCAARRRGGGPVGEWDEIGERGAASIPKSKLLVFLGAILEEASDEKRRAFLAKLPLQARVLWPLFGRRAYGRYIGTVRGTGTPRPGR